MYNAEMSTDGQQNAEMSTVFLLSPIQESAVCSFNSVQLLSRV